MSNPFHLSRSAAVSAAVLVDPRSPRLGAVVTTVVLAAALLTQTAVAPVSGTLLVVQTLVFALGAAGVSPYGVLFKRYVRPRLAPPSDLEDSRPLRFAQAVGLAFALLALVGLALPTSLVTTVALGFALAAAFLNAAFGICLGCELYLLFRRSTLLRAPLTDDSSATTRTEVHA